MYERTSPPIIAAAIALAIAAIVPHDVDGRCAAPPPSSPTHLVWVHGCERHHGEPVAAVATTVTLWRGDDRVTSREVVTDDRGCYEVGLRTSGDTTDGRIHVMAGGRSVSGSTFVAPHGASMVVADVDLSTSADVRDELARSIRATRVRACAQPGVCR